MIEILTRRSFGGLEFGSDRNECLRVLGEPQWEERFDDGVQELSYGDFDIFIEEGVGFNHVQITEPIDAVVDGSLNFTWDLGFVRELAKYDGDARLGEGGGVIKMKRIGAHVLGFHLGNPSDFCVGFDSDNSINEDRYPCADPPWQGDLTADS